MSEGEFAGMDAGEYYAMKDFIVQEKNARICMKNRTVVRHGMLADLKRYLEKSGWALLEPKGRYEVLRAVSNDYPRPLLVHDRTSGGCGYSIDERDMRIYRGWQKNRRKRGLDPYNPERKYCMDQHSCPVSSLECPNYEYGVCTKEEK